MSYVYSNSSSFILSFTILFLLFFFFFWLLRQGKKWTRARSFLFSLALFFLFSMVCYYSEKDRRKRRTHTHAHTAPSFLSEKNITLRVVVTYIYNHCKRVRARIEEIKRKNLTLKEKPQSFLYLHDNKTE
jgi:glucan phosphoethanolaminetransferase (alkaline phosphatase superfamily)